MPRSEGVDGPDARKACDRGVLSRREVVVLVRGPALKSCKGVVENLPNEVKPTAQFLEPAMPNGVRRGFLDDCGIRDRGKGELCHNYRMDFIDFQILKFVAVCALFFMAGLLGYLD